MNIGKTMCRIIWKDDFFSGDGGYSVPSDGLLAIASVAGFELEGYLVTRPDAARRLLRWRKTICFDRLWSAKA